MKILHRLACACVALSASTCVADVVYFSGPFTWYRMCGGVIGDPATGMIFDITQPASNQTGSLSSPNVLWYSLCGGFTSCGLNNQPIHATGILRSTTLTPVSRCTSTINLQLAHRLAVGDFVGPAAPSNATWQSTADVGATVGAGPQLMLVPPAIIGVNILLADGLHYGWVHLESTTSDGMGHSGFIVSEWAYETAPATPIRVGRPPCVCEFDGATGITSQDYFNFLTVFFAADLSADVNHDGSVTSQDYFDFLTCFFSAPGQCM